MRHVLTAWLSCLLLANHACGQELTVPTIEVASVKENVSDAGYGSRRSLPGGRLVIENFRLEQLLAFAYELGLGNVENGAMRLATKSSILSRRFDIIAVPAARAVPVTSADHPRMLRSLLADRFGLKTHIEVRERPIYALTVATPGRLGPQLRPTDIDCTVRSPGNETAEYKAVCFGGLGPHPPGGMRRRFAGPMWLLVNHAQRFLPERPVVDLTGLKGHFEWDVTIAIDHTQGPNPDNPLPLIFTAFREQLGLKLESRVGPVETLVIDSLHLPSPN